MKVEKDEVLEEIKKGLSWKERIILALFKDLFYYVYRKGMVDYFNHSNK